MEKLAFLRLFDRKLSCIWPQGNKASKQPSCRWRHSSKYGRSCEKEKVSTLYLIFELLRCISNKKINKYWQLAFDEAN